MIVSTVLDQVLLRAYLNQELDDAGNQAFELLLLDRPDLAEAVNADTCLSLGLGLGLGLAALPAAQSQFEREAAPAPSSQSALAEHPASTTRTGASKRASTWVRTWGRTVRRYAAPVAASLLIGLLLPKWLSPKQPAEGASVLYVDKMRSAGSASTLSLPAAGRLVLMLPIANPQCRTELELVQANQRLRAEVHPDEFGYAALLVDAQRLTSGAASVTVYCEQQLAGRYELILKR
jgi:hypothetical protein